MLLARSALSGIFLAAAVLKLRDPDATLLAVFQYKLISWSASGAVASFLPFVEIAAAVGLWIPRVRLGAALLALSLVVLFMAALGSAVARNLDVTCGCFGTSDLNTTALRRFAEDAVLLALCGALWFEEKRRIRPKLRSRRNDGS
jgi:hypothetical protein